MYGICMDSEGQNFDYLIADNYRPESEVPEGLETRVIPAGTWAVFPCYGALPKSLQDVNTKIWSEWLRLIEMYTKDMNYSEIWIPIEKN